MHGSFMVSAVPLILKCSPRLRSLQLKGSQADTHRYTQTLMCAKTQVQHFTSTDSDTQTHTHTHTLSLYLPLSLPLSLSLSPLSLSISLSLSPLYLSLS